MALAEQIAVDSFDSKSITSNFLQEVAKLSSFEKGPLLVKEFLSKKGIKFFVLEGLKGSKIDGACFLDSSGSPVVVLTLRYDRIDYFWFTLLHELAHVYRHLDRTNSLIVDDLDSKENQNKIERQADIEARNAFVPREIWKSSSAFITQTEAAVRDLARKQGIHESIIAGLLRHDTGNYNLHSNLLGQNQVKTLFGVNSNE
ncbi:MAG: ImmA/IrrE family metallo-endopeptidase [Chryseobacterium sp.]|nr:MAG: ImmA/IrrE family metallo-endopeptidase [Chryseobacterium sp.]